MADEADRDAYGAGRDQVVVNVTTGAEQSRPRIPRRIWGNVPARNPAFTGREELLGAVREALLSGDRTVVQALHGIGGVGKTQLAIEYAHRFASGYDVVCWINAEQASLIGEQFATLAAELDCAEPGAALDVVRRAVLMRLRESERWLLVFDNAGDPEDIGRWLPGGAGHVLITSRSHGWDEVAVPIEVDVLTRGESVTMLRCRVRGLSETDAGAVAEAVGDLPLAVAQAAGYIGETGMSAARYARLLAERAGEVLDQGRPSSYRRSLAAVTVLALERLRGEDPAAADLAVLCSVFAPQPIPADWFATAAAELPGALGERAADPVAWPRVVTRLGRSALARVERDGLLMHRLTQAIIRGHLSADQMSATRGLAEATLTVNAPGDDIRATVNWTGWARMIPHLLTLDLAATDNADLRTVAVRAAEYLRLRGDARASRDLAIDLYKQWRERLGPDDRYTLRAATGLAAAVHGMGSYAESRELNEDTLARRRRVLGDDHPDTLDAASNLAVDLRAVGEFRAARELNEDILARRRRVLGDDHPRSLGSASNLAGDLRSLADFEAARTLDVDTLARRRRVLGADHPDTLSSASNLAADLYDLQEFEAAQTQNEEILARRRRVLGADHPDTLMSASNLALVLRDSGDFGAAHVLDEDTLARRRRVLGADHPDTLESANNLAMDLTSGGDFGAARELDEHTLARRRRVLGDDHPDTLTSASNLAVDLRHLGDFAAARALVKDTLARRRRVLGDDHPDTRRSARNLAADLRALGEA